MGCLVAVKNVVCTFDLGRTLNCPLIATHLHARFDSGVFPAAVSYCAETRTSAQIFSTGKVVIVGCKTNDHGLHAAHLLVHTLLRTAGIVCGVYNFHVRNCVCRVSLHYKVNLDLFFDDAASGAINGIVLSDANGHGGPQLDHERFPGMAFALKDDKSDNKITVAMFDSGNGVGTGIKRPDQMDLLREFLDHTMYKYATGSEYRILDPDHARTRKRKPDASRKRKNNELQQL